MKKSAGVIVYKVNGDKNPLFFVGHPGGMVRNYWAYLKGGVEECENEVDAACREFAEESGIDIERYKGELEYVGQVRQNHMKTVVAYALDITHLFDIDVNRCKSNIYDKGWPEIDSYKWLSWPELKAVTHPTHAEFYEKIVNGLNQSTDDGNR